MTIILDGREFTDRDTAHNLLLRQLALPEYYGRNLDALYDLLTGRQETTILLRHRSALEQNLGAYGVALVRTLYDAARENPQLQMTEE